MKAKLSKREIDKLAPETKTYKVWDTELSGFFLRVSPRGRKTFAVRYFTKEGKDKTATVGIYGQVDPADARVKAMEMLSQASMGTDIQEEKKEARKQVEREKSETLGGFMEQHYKDYCRTHFKSHRKRIWLLSSYFSQWNEKNLTDINSWLVTNWRKDMIARGLQPAGVNRPVSALKALMNRAVEWGIIEVNPLNPVKPLKEDDSAVVRFLSPEEEKRLRGAIEDRQKYQRANPELYKRAKVYLEGEFSDYFKPLIVLALNTGMRKNELLTLTWEDVDFSNKSLVVLGMRAKSKQTRHVPMNSEAVHVLETWRNQTPKSGLVFPSPRTGKVIETIQTAWYKLMERAEIKNFRFHDLRHTFASKLVMAGVDLNTVRELLGHSDLKLTMRYAHLAPEHKAAAVELLAS